MSHAALAVALLAGCAGSTAPPRSPHLDEMTEAARRVGGLQLQCEMVQVAATTPEGRYVVRGCMREVALECRVFCGSILCMPVGDWGSVDIDCAGRGQL